MKPHASPQSHQPPPANDRGLDSAHRELARVLSGLPPLFATASYNGDDPKYKRISLPIEYREALTERFGSNYRVFYDPAGCLRLCPACLGESLFAEIQRELQDQRRLDLLADVEANQQFVELDAKGRLRLSYALTEPVGIQSDAVFCCRRWWLEIWAKERRHGRLTNLRHPTLSHGKSDSPTFSQTAPKQAGCIVSPDAFVESQPND